MTMLPPSGMASRALSAKVEDHLFDLTRIGERPDASRPARR